MKPVLLLIPGMLNTARIWARVVPLLQDIADVRIANVLSQSTIQAMATDAWTLLSDLQPGQPLVIAGFSMGGYVAIEMVANCHHPVHAIALLDTSSRPETEESMVVREKTIAAMARDFEKVIAGVAAFSTHAATHSDAALMQEALAIMREVGPEAAARQVRALMTRKDHRASLAQLNIPTLVLCGEDDKVTPQALSTEMAEQIPGARLELISQAGHMTPLEQPARVAALLASML
ncbi:alpha/beta hydrolase [Polaromonas sp.]|nr:alpha/beta hydrolase [Polaromonas sp.]